MAAARAFDAVTTLNNSGFGVLEVPPPRWQPERDPQRALGWCVDPVHHEVLGMTALLVTARGGDARMFDGLEVLESEVRAVRRWEPRVTTAEEWAVFVRIVLCGAALLVVIGVCVYFAWKSK